jgi:hypothetical protein
MKTPAFKTILAAAAIFTGAGIASNAQAASARDLDRDGIPNAVDPDIDNDGTPNLLDTNVDGGVSKSGPLRGRYIGDRIPNDSLAETDIDDDGKNDDAIEEEDIDGDRLNDDSASEKDIDGDRRADDATTELDIDGDGRADDNPSESDIDGDGRDDDAVDEADIDGDGRADDSSSESDIDGDGKSDDSVDELDIDGDGLNDDDASEDDTDGDGRHDGVEDDDDDGDSRRDSVDDDDDGDGHKGRNRGGDDDDETDDDSGPGLPGAQVGDGNAPAALTGIAYLVSENGTQLPERVQFLTASTGRVVDGADVDPFTYTFTPSGSTATVRLQFKSDKWDDYTLNFATGRFTRAETDKNVLKDTDTGTFALPQ